MKKIVLLAFVLVLLSTAGVVGFVRLIVAEGTIYIKSDGSVDPPTAPIDRDGDIYTFTGNISESIVVERDNIVIDGAGYTVEGTRTGLGIDLSHRSNVTVKNTKVIKFRRGILLDDSRNNTLTGNTVTNNDYYGITLLGWWSADNVVFHNNFINNPQQVWSIYWNSNTWDDGCPSGGNYWSDYTGVDTNMDGIGDSSYEIGSNNIDRYPLVGMFSDFSVALEEETYHVTTVCNSSISAFEFDQVNRIIRFNVTGEEGIGFCRVCIPHDLMEPPYTVTVDGHSPQYVNYTLYDNGTHRWIYFTYLHSTHKVEIIPEFPTWTSMLLILIVLTVTIAIYKRRPLKTRIH